MSPLRVVLSDQCKKELGRLPRDLAARVLKAIFRYAESGYGDVKKLQGATGEYRLRVGEWRVLFAIDYSSVEMVVQHVLPRGSAYRD